MDSPWITLPALALMLLATGLGAWIRHRWPEHHSNRETIELLQTTVMMLATFAAIVLGLLITSAKSDFDDIENDIGSLSSSLVQLDLSLEQLGPEAVPARQDLARYAGGAIAATWTDEAQPLGSYYPLLPRVTDVREHQNSPVLGQMLEQVDTMIRGISVNGVAAQRQLESSLRLMTVLLNERWQLVEASEVSLSSPFFVMLVFWLVVIFLCFGLSAPFNHLSFTVTALSALALTSALFVIIDLYTPYDGIFTVSSVPLRQALAEMLSQPDGMPPISTPR